MINTAAQTAKILTLLRREALAPHPSIALGQRTSWLVRPVLGHDRRSTTTPSVSFRGLINQTGTPPQHRLRDEAPGDSIEGLWFHPTPDFDHRPGQFVEISLPHAHPDSRGIRREFTIASSPTEPGILLAMKFTSSGSTLKQALHTLNPGDHLEVTFVGGEFLLPPDPTVPILMLAGGIGITPFRAMLKYLTDGGEQRDITLVYAAKNPEDFVFADVLNAAEQQGTTVLRLISIESAGWMGKRGRLDPATIQRLVPDLAKREIYVSGPEPMVESLAKSLPLISAPIDSVHRDSFPGYRTIG